MTSGNQFASSNGNIVIASTKGTSIGGNVKNFGNGNITVTNTGSEGTKISGKISNANGNLTIHNSAGALNAASGSEIKIKVP